MRQPAVSQTLRKISNETHIEGLNLALLKNLSLIPLGCGIGMLWPNDWEFSFVTKRNNWWHLEKDEEFSSVELSSDQRVKGRQNRTIVEFMKRNRMGNFPGVCKCLSNRVFFKCSGQRMEADPAKGLVKNSRSATLNRARNWATSAPSSVPCSLSWIPRRWWTFPWPGCPGNSTIVKRIYVSVSP